MTRLQLHAVGDARIVVGKREFRPSAAPHAFAALLYLVESRGRRVPRAELQALLFPDADEKSAGHSLRQALYRFKQQSVPIDTDPGTVSIPASAVIDAAPEGDDPSPEELQRLAQGFLPDYTPGVSPAFARWVDELRAARTARIRAQLLAALARARTAGERAQTQNVAAALLKLDPLNEEATLARAEALALAGQKRDAVRLLDAYAGEVGATADLRVAPETLRRRIADRLDEGERTRAPLLGRADELAWLLGQFARAAAGTPTVTVLWGDAGVGKTRLVEELRAHAVLRGARLQTAHCQPHDVERPLGALVDLLPNLLELRGALGVAPASMELLKRFAGSSSHGSGDGDQNPEFFSARVRAAFADLLSCVTSEGALVLLVEDAHWLDSASLRLLMLTVLAGRGPLHLILTRRGQPQFPAGTKQSESAFLRQIEPLGPDAAAELLLHLAGDRRPLDAAVLGQCVAIAGGNPLFLCTIGEHLRLSGSVPSAESSIMDLLRQRIRLLDGRSLLLLRCVAALGTHGTRERLRASSGIAGESALLALQELADRGLVLGEQGSIRCSHVLLSEAVLHDTPRTFRLVLFERVAEVLEQEGLSDKQVGLLWSCAESWRLAENSPRAIRALRRCADFAVEIGQPAFAVTALEKAQELADSAERESLTEDSIRLADAARDNEAVRRNVSRYRALLRGRGATPPPHHFSELAEITAIWIGGTFPLDRTGDLRRMVLDTRAPLNFRRRAFRLLTIASDLQMSHEVESLLAQVPDLVADTSDPAALHVRVSFYMSHGDVGEARSAALALLPMIRARQPGTNPIWMHDVAMALSNSGSTALAIDVLHETELRDQKLGLPAYAYLACLAQVAMHVLAGDLESAHACQARGARLEDASAKAFLSLKLSNDIDLALARHDADAARRAADALRATPDGSKLMARRVLLHADVLIGLLDGTLSSAPWDLEEARRLELACRPFPNSHGVACALFVLEYVRGDVERGRRAMRDWARRRHDRFPVLPWFRSQPLPPAIVEEIEQAIGEEHLAHAAGAG